MEKSRTFMLVLGVFIGLAAWNILASPQAAIAGNGGGENKIIVGTATFQAGQEDLIYVVDTELKRMALYSIKGKTISLTSVRLIAYDLKLQSIGREAPLIKDIKSKVENRGRKKGN